MPSPQIFLSYAREDESVAKRLCNDLRTKGRKVWFDKDCLRGGEKWRSAINMAIRKSDFFVALLSGESVTKRGMVQAEIQRALNVLEEIPEDRIYLIPVRLTECEPSHARLSELHWVDLFPRWEDGVAEILRSTDPDPGEPDLSDGPTPLDDLIGSMSSFPKRPKPPSEPTRMSEAVREAIDFFKAYAAERNVEIRFQDGAPNAFVRVNKQLFITAVAIILNNAIKYSYTIPGKVAWVDVSARESVKGAELKVENWGGGIEASAYNAIGDGLGLALVKHMCDEYNGAIQIQSRPVRSSSRGESAVPYVTIVKIILQLERDKKITVELGRNLPPVRVPYDPKFRLREFLDLIYHKLDGAVEPYTFGHSWVLVDTTTGRRMFELEPDSEPGIESDDDFLFSEVGLGPGIGLRVEIL